MCHAVHLWSKPIATTFDLHGLQWKMKAYLTKHFELQAVIAAVYSNY